MDLMLNLFLNEKWLHFGKTQFATQNGLKRDAKCIFQKKKVEVLGKPSFQNKMVKDTVSNNGNNSELRVDGKCIFKQEMVKIMKTKSFSNEF